MYDIEDLIDELIIRSAQRRSREAIIRCILSLVDLPRQFFYVLALIDLTDSYRFYKKLELIKVNISRIFSMFFQGGIWHNTSSPYDLEIGTTIVSPVISKFEALATKRQLRPAVRKQARWLRDEFKSLKVFLKDLESRETLSERGIAWTEELCDVCRSTENVVGLFLTKNEKGNPKSLVWSPHKFISQHNLVQQMARIQVKVSDISERRYEAIHQRTWHRDRYPSITPSVIVKLAELLSHREATLEEWSTALDQLNQDEEPWSTVLEEINKYLPLYLRQCLFYFGLFPVGYKVPARRLMALWVAEGLGHQKNGDNSPEDAAEACLRELISYNMVQVTERKPNGKVKTCSLPEALRVHWLAKAKEANFLRGHNENNCAIRRVADHLDRKDPIFEHIHGNNTTSLDSCYRDTVTFISFDTREGSRAGQDIGNFLDRCISSKCFHFLWVLDLENVYKPKLPKAVGQLFHLRYLGLRSTYLEMLPMFKLLNLQTLDLKRTCIDTLPTSIWKMQKLRHLFLDESFCSSFFPPQEPNSLMDLQTFWGVFIDENSPVNDGLDSLLGIRKLALKCKLSVPSQKAAMSLQLFNIADWVVNLKHLQSLRLKSFDESGQPWDLHLQALSGNAELSDKYLVGKLKNQDLISKFPQSLTELTLSASGLIDDPMQQCSTVTRLPNLRMLRLFSDHFQERKNALPKDGGFQSLEVPQSCGLSY
ncbi:disease resistance protein RPM1-like [Jatropha curcas]|uniref:disease resistance protein RPM1-like n=1 Tax=Jatropha curcas TaxID=180498 RepID=UPI001895C0B7|nr:disease resistance protein RPM1-like [Jatropha curcas]